MDLILCIDSSASFCLSKESSAAGTCWVESGTFQRAKGFLQLLAASVDMPEVQLGLLRFEEVQEVICSLTDQFAVFLHQLRGMHASPGETRVAPVLRQALCMLEDNNRPTTNLGHSEVRKAVIVITDGDPHDPNESALAAASLREKGVQILFVRIRTRNALDRQLGCSKLEQLAVPSTASWLHENAKGVLEVDDTEDALQGLVPDVLQQILFVSQRVKRARCLLPITPYKVVRAAELDAWEGIECYVPGSELGCANGHSLIPFFHTECHGWDSSQMKSPDEIQQRLEDADRKMCMKQIEEPQQEPQQEPQAHDSSPMKETFGDTSASSSGLLGIGLEVAKETQPAAGAAAVSRDAERYDFGACEKTLEELRVRVQRAKLAAQPRQWVGK